MRSAARLPSAALAAVLVSACCSPRPSTELRTAERVADTVDRLVYVDVHDTVRETVYDTIRETTVVRLDAKGDTAGLSTDRVHSTDRTRQRASASRQAEASTSRHEEDREEHGKETVVERPKQTPARPFLWGSLAGAALALAASLFLRRLFSRR